MLFSKGIASSISAKCRLLSLLIIPLIYLHITSLTCPATEAGDLNNDGNIDLSDAILALQISSGLHPDGVNIGGDVNSDNHISIVEAIYDLQEVSKNKGWLHTRNNHIYKADATIWAGRGVNIHDTRSCNACTASAPNVAEVKRRIDQAVDVWHADFLRLTLESYDTAAGYRVHWQDLLHDPEYLADVVEIVDYIGEKEDVYVLVSLWVDPSFNNQGWPTADTIEVWKVLSAALYGKPHVLFGLVNEPQANYSGSQDPQVWTAMNNTVAAIRQIENGLPGDYHHIITVQGTRSWARILTYYITHPITAGNGVNIAYETHVYDPQSTFNSRFIVPAQTLPVIIGEFGYVTGAANMSLADCTKLMDEAENRNIPYLAWTFHQRCDPSLLTDYTHNCGVNMNLTPSSGWGELIFNRLSAGY